MQETYSSNVALDDPDARPSTQPTKRAELLRAWLAPFQVADVSAYALVLAFCFLAFQHGDLYHTVGCSLGYLRGHFADFYEYNTERLGGINYLPSTYLLYAVAGLPLKALGLMPDESLTLPPNKIVFYYKAVNALFYLGTAVVVRSIARTLGLSPRRASMAMLIWATAPLAVFSTFIFGQYDVLTAFVTVLALRSYFRGELWGFTGWMSLAATFKYFPLFVFVPLLLLAEKRVRHVLSHTAVVGLPIALEIFVYRGSSAFKTGVFGFFAAKRTASFVVDNGSLPLSVMLCAWTILCAFAYLHDDANTLEAKRRWGLRYGVIAAGFLFFVVGPHPQWLMFITPFFALAAATHPRWQRFMVLDVAMMAAFVPLVILVWPLNVDQSLWSHGLFMRFNPQLQDLLNTFQMVDLIGANSKVEFWAALFYGVMLAYPVLALGGADVGGLEADPTAAEVGALWWRAYAGLACWLLPACASYLVTQLGYGGVR